MFSLVMVDISDVRLTQAVFLDKDGTLIENVPLSVDVERIRWLPGVISGLKMLGEAGYRLVVVSNQPGVALGLFSEDDVLRVEHAMRAQLERSGIRLDGFYYCPHHPEGSVTSSVPTSASTDYVHCDCRKPAPGLVLEAAAELGLELARCWFIGDILHDVEAGTRAGCRTILVDVGNESEWQWSDKRIPDYVTASFDTAAQIITRQTRSTRECRRTPPQAARQITRQAAQSAAWRS